MFKPLTISDIHNELSTHSTSAMLLVHLGLSLWKYYTPRAVHGSLKPWLTVVLGPRFKFFQIFVYLSAERLTNFSFGRTVPAFLHISLKWCSSNFILIIKSRFHLPKMYDGSVLYLEKQPHANRGFLERNKEILKILIKF